MKKTLLSSSAIAGAALLAAPVATPAFAGTPAVGDNFTVTISGNLRFTTFVFDQDIRDTRGTNANAAANLAPVGIGAGGRGRGYHFASDESEIKFAAGGVADNGLEYGFELELQTQTNDGDNSDETWGYLRGNWGEINVGDQDSAADRMAIGGEDAMPGRGGYDGGYGDVALRAAGYAFNGPGSNFTGDATKITYFTPRVFGFQLGGSWTPDAGSGGSTGINDADTSFENVASFGVNYAENFGGFGVIIAGTFEWADERETTLPAGSILLPGGQPGVSADDAWQSQVGAKFSYAGFEIGGAAGFGHNLTVYGPAATGGAPNDAGWWWDVGLKYSTGPWTIGGGYFYSEADNGSMGFSGPDTSVQVISVGGNYQVAPGMALATDVNFFEVDNLNRAVPGAPASPGFTGNGLAAVDNSGYVWVFSTIFSF